jgi:glycine/D-amino acid oxidase-like deaminating enzyme
MTSDQVHRAVVCLASVKVKGVDVWITDSTPVERGRSRPTAKRSDLAGWAGYGYCASHSRFFWGLGLHLICALSGLPIAWSPATAKIDDRQVLTASLEEDPGLLADRRLTSH